MATRTQKGGTKKTTTKQSEFLEEDIVEINVEETKPDIKNTAFIGREHSEIEMIDIKERYREIILYYQGDIEKALFQICFENNIFYDNDLLQKKFLKNREDDILDKMPEVYIWEIENNVQYKGLTFFSQIKIDNFNKIYAEDLSLLLLTEDDKKNRQQIISILGYDPFKNDAPEERAQLYRDLAGMLSEAMRKDIPKQKAAVEVVRNYANIGRYQKRATEIAASGQIDEGTQKELDNLLTVIARIQSNVNQTTKENGFTGGKSIGSGGRGMLSDVMLQCEELGYDDGITNYYDIKTSKSIAEIANISWKAMMNQLNLSDTDYADILINQSKIVKTAQRTAADALEAARLAREKVTKQELILELEQEYRKKGISEEEIEEFVKREYKLKEGKE